MRLAELLARLDAVALENIATHGLAERDLPPTFLAGALESSIRSYAHIRQTVIRRQPPAFAVLVKLCETAGHRLDHDVARQLALEETEMIAARVNRGELGRPDSVRLYTRVLAEARRSDLDLDPSELMLLGVLRGELGLSLVEHFLLEHHDELRGMWDAADAFERELKVLAEHGLLFAVDGDLVLPEDLAPVIRQSLGMRHTRTSLRRLADRLTGRQLADALGAKQARSAGSKEERVDRVVENFVQPAELLAHVNLADLREIARDVGCAVSGSRDELAERLVAFFERNGDLAPQEDIPPPPPEREPRTLTRDQFRAMFVGLTGQQLSDVLALLPDSRQSGSKDQRVNTLWDSHLSEVSLLSALTNRDLEWLLGRQELRVAGSKPDRIQRLITHYATTSLSAGRLEADESTSGFSPDDST